jgi:hypothetical protein
MVATYKQLYPNSTICLESVPGSFFLRNQTKFIKRITFLAELKQQAQFEAVFVVLGSPELTPNNSSDEKAEEGQQSPTAQGPTLLTSLQPMFNDELV